jgi:hypothetical protein
MIRYEEDACVTLPELFQTRPYGCLPTRKARSYARNTSMIIVSKGNLTRSRRIGELLRRLKL